MVYNKKDFEKLVEKYAKKADNVSFADHLRNNLRDGAIQNYMIENKSEVLDSLEEYLNDNQIYNQDLFWEMVDDNLKTKGIKTNFYNIVGQLNDFPGSEFIQLSVYQNEITPWYYEQNIGDLFKELEEKDINWEQLGDIYETFAERELEQQKQQNSMKM